MENNLLQKYPLVCVCVPVRNGGGTILATLNSLLSQDYPNIEIVICDNLSTDDTKRIIEDVVLSSHIPVTYIENIVGGSAEANWNFLLKSLKTKADYIALYHADDLYEPTIISEQLRLITETSSGAVFTISRLIDENGVDVSKKYKHNISLPNDLEPISVFDYESLLHYTLKYYNFVKAPTFFFHKSILSDFDIFFDSAFKTSADLDFWLRIAKKHNIAIVRKPLHLYRISRTQGTYTLLRGKEKPGDYFGVMDYHISQNIAIDEKAIRYYNAYKSLDLVMCSLNLSKNNKKTEAIRFLKDALKINHIPYLVHIPNGIRNFIFGIALRIALSTRMEKTLIKVIGH